MNTNFNPFVRYIAKSTYIIEKKFIIANDCRLIYILSGSGRLESNGKVYPLSPGTLVYYPCGTPYKFLLCTENKLLFYTVNFDFSHDYSNISPMGPEEYKGVGGITMDEDRGEVFAWSIWDGAFLVYDMQGRFLR